MPRPASIARRSATSLPRLRRNPTPSPSPTIWRLSYALDGKADKAEAAAAERSGKRSRRQARPSEPCAGARSPRQTSTRRGRSHRPTCPKPMPRPIWLTSRACSRRRPASPRSAQTTMPRTVARSGSPMPRMRFRPRQSGPRWRARHRSRRGRSRHRCVTRSTAAAKGDRIAAVHPAAPVAPQGSGSTTIAKSQPVAEATPPADAATKADKRASAPTPTRTADLLKADIE